MNVTPHRLNPLIILGVIALSLVSCTDSGTSAAKLDKLRSKDKELEQTQKTLLALTAEDMKAIANSDTPREEYELRKNIRLKNAGNLERYYEIQAERIALGRMIDELGGTTTVSSSRPPDTRADGSGPNHSPSPRGTAKEAGICINNLRTIETLKDLWALESGKTDGDMPKDSELFDRGPDLLRKPTCPSSGTYTLGKVGEKPKCTIPGHELP